MVYVVERVSMERWENFELVPLDNLKSEHKLFDFQNFAVYLGLEMPRFLNGIQTGLGKTVCSYATYFYYKNKFPKTK